MIFRIDSGNRAARIILKTSTMIAEQSPVTIDSYPGTWLKPKVNADRHSE